MLSFRESTERSIDNGTNRMMKINPTNRAKVRPSHLSMFVVYAGVKHTHRSVRLQHPIRNMQLRVSGSASYRSYLVIGVT